MVTQNPGQLTDPQLSSGPYDDGVTLQRQTRYAFRCSLPMIQIAVYLAAEFKQRAGNAELMHSVLKSNLLVALIAQFAFRNLSLVPLNFWYVIALGAVWYFAGFALDVSAARVLRRDTRFPVRMILLGAVIALCAAYSIYCAQSSADIKCWSVLIDAAWFCIVLGLGWVIERLFAKARRTTAFRRREALLWLVYFSSGYLAWATMHDPFDQLFAAKPNTPLDPNTPPNFWLIYPFAQIGNLLFYVYGFRLGIFLSQRRHLTPGEEIIWPAGKFIPRLQQAIRDLADRWNWRHTVGTLAFVWCCGCILVQDRTFAVKVVVAALVVIFFIAWMFPKVGQYRWALLAVFAATAVLTHAGSYHMAVDIALFAVALAVVFWYFHRSRPKTHRHPQTMAFLAVILCTWLLWSLGDGISTARPAPRNPGRFLTLANSDTLRSGKHIGLALSGGGYRAALMHAGVLDGLEKLGLRPTNLSSVSGGSVTASYYAAGGSPEELLHVFENRRLLLYRDLIDAQNLVRIIFPARIPGTHVELLPFYSFSRTNLNAQALDRVFLQNLRFGEIGAGPKLMIDVTDLNSGRAIGTTKDWMLTRFLLRPPGEELFPNAMKLYDQTPRLSRDSTFAVHDADDEKLSQFVSASAAFPIAFEPVALDMGKLGRYLLSDGGITDNSAMTLLLEADRRASLSDSSQGDRNWLLDLAISSDGGAMFTQADGSTDQGFGRAIDIIDARIGLQMPTGPRGAQHPKGPPVVLLSPSLYVDNSRNDVDFGNFAFRYNANYYFYVLGPNGEELPINSGQKMLVELIESQIKGLDMNGVALLATIHKGAPTDVVIGAQESSQRLQLNREKDYMEFVHDLRDDPRTASLTTSFDNDPNDPVERSMSHMVAIQLLTGGIAEDFSRCLETFLNTPTLTDSFSPQQADDLFRLGQYLVLLNEHEIRRQLAGLQMSDKVTSILTSREQTEVVCMFADKIVRTPDPPDHAKAMQQAEEWGEREDHDYENCMRAHGLRRNGTPMLSRREILGAGAEISRASEEKP